ncbi:hypothetical protein HAX54_045107 [Datura stramonium]|uniref:Uncharacterized protein n=1 Tax=Datura stramonium TaxID=4076 RepID=A0ABS8SQ89_DATST|nr:hypothetical protein [Datura stramonium]
MNRASVVFKTSHNPSLQIVQQILKSLLATNREHVFSRFVTKAKNNSAVNITGFNGELAFAIDFPSWFVLIPPEMNFHHSLVLIEAMLASCILRHQASWYELQMPVRFVHSGKIRGSKDSYKFCKSMKVDVRLVPEPLKVVVDI